MIETLLQLGLGAALGAAGTYLTYRSRLHALRDQVMQRQLDIAERALTSLGRVHDAVVDILSLEPYEPARIELIEAVKVDDIIRGPVAGLMPVGTVNALGRYRTHIRPIEVAARKGDPSPFQSEAECLSQLHLLSQRLSDAIVAVRHDLRVDALSGGDREGLAKPLLNLRPSELPDDK